MVNKMNIENIKNVIVNKIECDDIKIIENGIEFVQFEAFNKITFENDKVIYELVSEEDDYNIIIKINKALFESDIENFTYKLWDMSLMLSEGDRENENENLFFDLSDEEFLNFN